jgi:hypothetical protein
LFLRATEIAELFNAKFDRADVIGDFRYIEDARCFLGRRLKDEEVRERGLSAFDSGGEHLFVFLFLHLPELELEVLRAQRHEIASAG